MARSGRVLDTPFGPLTVVVDGRGVVASGFRPPARGRSASRREANALLDHAERAVAAWVSGADLRCAGPGAGVRCRARASARTVWRAMREVPPGATDSYGGLAAAAGRPGAARAAGTACATNPVAPFVPCHRIVRSDGSLGEYGYGPGLKRALLEHEGAI